MGEHSLPRPGRELQMIGASEAAGKNYAWFYGQNHDYLMEVPSGRVVAEVSCRPSPMQARDDTLWAVSWIEKMIPGKDLPVQLFFVSRTAARLRVEAEYTGPVQLS